MTVILVGIEDRLYMTRQVGGRGLICVEEFVKAEKLGLATMWLAAKS